MSRKRCRVLISVLILVFLLGLAGCGQTGEKEPGENNGIEKAAAFTLKELQSGKELSYPEDFADRKIILSFFSVG